MMSGERTDIEHDKIGNIFISLGMLLILGALGLTIFNRWDSARAAKASQGILEQLITKISQTPEVELNTAMWDISDREMPTVEIDEYLYIGTIEIPSAGIYLPVMAEWDYKKLRISPCRYAGSCYTDDLVICGHNYPSHFSPIKWLDLGAEVRFTDVNGEIFQYAVSNIEKLQSTAVEQMITNSNNSEESKNDWDLTLFTCDMSGRVRYAVRCVRLADVTGLQNF